MIPRKAGAFSPGHITGFFVIEDSDASAEKKGSLGAGVSLSSGVETEVSLNAMGKNDKSEITIFINGRHAGNALVSERVIKIFLSRMKDAFPCRMIVDHRISLPMGAGFGSSGAGALSLAIALDAVFSTGMTLIRTAQIAHQSEVEMKTGLGTVIGETFGGIEIRIKAGAPGIGGIQRVDFDNRQKVAALVFGPLPTQEFLSSRSIREKINKHGRSLVDQLSADPSIPHFLALSRDFTAHTGVITKEIDPILRKGDAENIVMGMLMFGNGVFTITHEDELDRVLRIFRKYGKGGEIIVSDIDRKGAHLLYGN